MSAASFEKSRLELVGTLQGHSRGVRSVSFSPDGTKVASGSLDETVKLWHATSGECLRTLEGHSSYVMSVSFSLDGTKVASGSWDKTVKLWDVTSGECLQTLEGHSWSVKSVSFSSDGTKVAARSRKYYKIWDTSTGSCTFTGKALPNIDEFPNMISEATSDDINSYVRFEGLPFEIKKDHAVAIKNNNVHFLTLMK